MKYELDIDQLEDEIAFLKERADIDDVLALKRALRLMLLRLDVEEVTEGVLSVQLTVEKARQLRDQLDRALKVARKEDDTVTVWSIEYGDHVYADLNPLKELIDWQMNRMKTEED